MNEQLNSYVGTLIEDTMMVMDEYQTPVMAFTATVLDKIEDLLDCKDITKEHCRLTKKMVILLGKFMHMLKVQMAKFYICFILIITITMK